MLMNDWSSGSLYSSPVQRLLPLIISISSQIRGIMKNCNVEIGETRLSETRPDRESHGKSGVREKRFESSFFLCRSKKRKSTESEPKARQEPPKSANLLYSRSKEVFIDLYFWIQWEKDFCRDWVSRTLERSIPLSWTIHLLKVRESSTFSPSSAKEVAWDSIVCRDKSQSKDQNEQNQHEKTSQYQHAQDPINLPWYEPLPTSNDRQS